MSRNEYVPTERQEIASRAGLRGVAWHVAFVAVLTLLTLWPLLLLAGFIIAAHWAAELACGWEWLRC